MQENWLIFALLSSILWGAATCLAVMWLLPIWDQMMRVYVGDYINAMRDLDLDESKMEEAMRWWGFSLLGVFIFFTFVLRMPPVALGLTYLVFICPRFFLAYMVEARRKNMRDQMVRVTTALVSSVRAGMSLPDSLAEVSRDTPEPMGKVIRRIVSEYQAGRPLADSLKEVQNRINLEVFTLFATSIVICMERGGKITFALERMCDGLIEVQRVERKLEVDTASGRRLSIILGLFPVAFLMLFTLLDPQSMGLLYTNFFGQCVLLLVGIIIYFAVRWCMWILDIEI